MPIRKRPQRRAVPERPKSVDEIINGVWNAYASGKKRRVTPFQKDVMLASQPTAGTVVSGFDPSRTEEGIKLDFDRLRRYKDLYEGVQDEEARSVGLSPIEYRELFKEGVFDAGADPDSVRKAARGIIDSYSKYTNYGKVEIPHKVTTGVRMIADAYRQGGLSAAKAMRSRLDAASSAFAASAHEVTPEEKSLIEAAKQRVVRDHVMVAPLKGNGIELSSNLLAVLQIAHGL